MHILEKRTRLISFLIVSIIMTSSMGQAQRDIVCWQPLGLQDKRVPDSSLTATSQHAAGTGPRYARLGRNEGYGAWCPKGYLEPGTETEFIQVELPQLSYVTEIATQGRLGDGTGREFTRHYKLNYSRDDVTWHRWTDFKGTQVLSGNTDPDTVQRQRLTPSLDGVKFIRVIPQSARRESPCLRFELYGCAWNSDLFSYDITTPLDRNKVQKSGLSDFDDITYDGMTSSVTYTGGLGQLTDGVIGDDDITKTVTQRAQSRSIGFDYVGWSNSDVTMTFRFLEVRNFTSIKFHCSNDFKSGARIFSSIEVSFSLDGVNFPGRSSPPSVAYNAPDDVTMTSSRWVVVPLNHAVARYIRAKVRVRGKLLLVSEVQFESDPIHPDELSRYKIEPGDFPTPTMTPSDVTNTALIVGVLLGVIALLAVIVMALCYRQHRLRKTMTPPRYSYHSGRQNRDTVTLTPLVTSQAPPLQGKPPIPIYQEIGPTSIPPDHLYLQPTDVIVAPDDVTMAPPPYQQHDAEAACSSQSFLERPQVVVENTSHYAETDLILPNIKPQAIQGVTGNNVYAVPWSTPSPKRSKSRSAASTLAADDVIIGFPTNSQPPEFPREKLEFIEKLGEGQFGEVQLCKADPSLRSVVGDKMELSGNTGDHVLVAVKVLRGNVSNDAKEDFLKEVKVMSGLQHDNIVRLIAVDTSGHFAMITEYMEHGDLNQFLRGFGSEFPANGEEGTSKTIGNDALLSMAAQIAAGMEYLSSRNVVHRDLAARNCLVGTSHSSHPGTAHSIRIADSGTSHLGTSHSGTAHSGTAHSGTSHSGSSHPGTSHPSHPGTAHSIRIADFGMSRSLYHSDYYRIQGRAVLPIRWMSWECVLMGKFSSASDMWAFGVTLWEIFSLCRVQPFHTLTDQEVIENMHHVFRRTREETSLPRPKRCGASLFNMMKQTWKRSPEDRPTFEQIRRHILTRPRDVINDPRPRPPTAPAPKPRHS